MTILQKLAEKILEYSEGFKVIEYCACLRATYVIVEDKEERRFLGMSHIAHENLHNQGKIIAPNVDNLTELTSSINIINRSFGLSLINAISQKFIKPTQEFPEIRDPVCIVGNMKPLVKEFSNRKVYVFEKSTELRDDALSDAEEELLLQECKTVFITGVTLLNLTLERILEISKGTNILIGPSASIIPDLMRDFNIHYIQSMIFNDVDKIRDHLRLGNFVSLKINKELGVNFSAKVNRSFA